MKCFFCEGPAHPATGHAYSETCLACRRCYLDFFAWYRARMHNPIAQVAVADKARRELEDEVAGVSLGAVARMLVAPKSILRSLSPEQLDRLVLDAQSIREKCGGK